MSIKEQIAALPNGKIEVEGFGLGPRPAMTPKQAEQYQAAGYGLHPEPGITSSNLKALAESHTRLLDYVKGFVGKAIAGEAIEQAEKL